METKNDLRELLSRPVWQMTGMELCTLTQYANVTSQAIATDVRNSIQLTGVRKLAEYLDCCESTIYMLLRNHILEDAIVSRIGKKIVFNGEKARELANQYQRAQRALKKQ